MRGLGRPLRRLVERPQREQGLGHGQGDGIALLHLFEQPGIVLGLAALEQLAGLAVVLGVEGAAAGPEDGREPVADQEVGADRPVAVLGVDVQGPEPVVEEELLERDDRLAAPAPFELDFGQEQPRRQPVAVRPRHAGGGGELPRRLRPVAVRPRLVPELHQQPELMVAGGVDQEHAVDRLRGARPPQRVLERLQGELLLADRLRRLRQPVIVRRLLGRVHDLLAVALDQAAVLAEDHHPVGLGDDQVAVADGEVAAGRLERLLELDRRLDGQPGGLVEDLDLVPGRPVDLVAGEQAPPEPLVGAAAVGPGVDQLAGLDVEEEHAVAGGDQPPLGHAQQVRQLDLVGDRLGLPDEPAAGGVEGEDRRRVVGGDDDQAVVDDRRVQVAVAPAPPSARSWRG